MPPTTIKPGELKETQERLHEMLVATQERIVRERLNEGTAVARPTGSSDQVAGGGGGTSGDRAGTTHNLEGRLLGSPGLQTKSPALRVGGLVIEQTARRNPEQMLRSDTSIPW